MTTAQKNLPPGFWIGIILILILLLIPLFCKAAKYDTIQCKSQCIEKIITQPTKGGKKKCYVIYKDTNSEIIDIIPVSDATLSYIELCKQNGIPPCLGIKLKDGQIYSIIKYKPKYRRIKK